MHLLYIFAGQFVNVLFPKFFSQLDKNNVWRFLCENHIRQNKTSMNLKPSKKSAFETIASTINIFYGECVRSVPGSQPHCYRQARVEEPVRLIRWWCHEQSTLSQDALSQHGKVGCQKLASSCQFVIRRRRRKQSTKWRKLKFKCKQTKDTWPIVASISHKNNWIWNHFKIKIRYSLEECSLTFWHFDIRLCVAEFQKHSCWKTLNQESSKVVISTVILLNKLLKRTFEFPYKSHTFSYL